MCRSVIISPVITNNRGPLSKGTILEVGVRGVLNVMEGELVDVELGGGLAFGHLFI